MECGFQMANSRVNLVSWFKRYRTLKSVPFGQWVGRSVGHLPWSVCRSVGSIESLMLRKNSHSAKARSAFGLIRSRNIFTIDYLQ